MGVAQHRQSKSRVRKRRAMWKLTALTLRLPPCHQPKLQHFVCPNCGYYKAKQVIDLST